MLDATGVYLAPGVLRGLSWMPVCPLLVTRDRLAKSRSERRMATMRVEELVVLASSMSVDLMAEMWLRCLDGRVCGRPR